MTNTHTHNGPSMKIKNMVVTRVERNGHPGYRVEAVSNSVEYWPPQILEISEVEKLCNDDHWQVNVAPPIPGRP